MSTLVATHTQYTPEDLLAMPDGRSYELVGGLLVERNMGMESSRIATRLASRLEWFCEEKPLGSVFTADNGYQCFPHEPGLVRRPDVSFIRDGRLPGGVVPKGWAKIPPDLAVEVVSPNDSAYMLEDKLEDYRKVRVPLAWVIYPNSRKVMVYRADGSTSLLREGAELPGEDVIPGFRCALREILTVSEASAEVQPTPAIPNGQS